MSVVYVLCVILALLQILDGYTTVKALGRGSREINPIVRIFIEKFGLVPALVFIKAICVAVAVYIAYASFIAPHNTSLLYVISILDIVYSAIVVSNFYVLSKLK